MLFDVFFQQAMASRAAIAGAGMATNFGYAAQAKRGNMGDNLGFRDPKATANDSVATVCTVLGGMHIHAATAVGWDKPKPQ